MPKVSSKTAIRENLMREHVPYEFDMIRSTFDILFAPEPLPLGHTRNALIESFAFHSRALIDFFNGKGGSDARHFTGAGYVPFRRGPISKMLVGKLDQQVAHITEKRTNKAHLKLNGADMATLRRRLNIETDEFLLHMKPEYRAIWSVRRDGR